MAETITLPGAVDLHVHLREPSTNTSETIFSGSRAAMLGGYALIADMSNNPGFPTWFLARIKEKRDIARRDSHIPIAFFAGSQPEPDCDNIGELEAMSRIAIAMKLYGDPTTGNDNTYDAWDFRERVEEWHRVAEDKPIMFHAGEENLEDMIDLVARDVGHPMHVCHVNSTREVYAVHEAKKEGLNITCGVCPHHLMMTSHDVHSHGSFAQMKPPLARQEEAEELMNHLVEGRIDVIESDFAPHSVDSKLLAENSDKDCYGVPGIEHIMPILMYQVKKGRLPERRLIEVTSTKPADILGVRLGQHTKAVWDVSEGVYKIEESDVAAGCDWSPYVGMLGYGRLQKLSTGGKVTHLANRMPRPSRRVISKRGSVI